MVKRNFNKDWIFRRGSSEALAEVLAGGTADERRITLPHDASIEISRDPSAAVETAISEKAITSIRRCFIWSLRKVARIYGLNLRVSTRMLLCILTILMRGNARMVTEASS